ncbi:MAG: hypothetical protein ACK4SN_08050, partial [Bellilinea sp.]
MGWGIIWWIKSGIFNAALAIEKTRRALKNASQPDSIFTQRTGIPVTDIRDTLGNAIKEHDKQRQAFAEAEQKNIKSPVLKFAGDIAEGAAQMLPSLMLGGTGGGPLQISSLIMQAVGPSYEKA